METICLLEQREIKTLHKKVCLLGLKALTWPPLRKYHYTYIHTYGYFLADNGHLTSFAYGTDFYGFDFYVCPSKFLKVFKVL